MDRWQWLKDAIEKGLTRCKIYDDDMQYMTEILHQEIKKALKEAKTDGKC